ncbi:hypothetical protein P7228_12400 [Altererythrobacter arenosus]|uniref:Uncharacterized protein n=1 Tax=Altererythrobacter arenosus TaxID=3032592 RepID=A0ABY8FRR1_9SPHN|nr:hypothetical protein [Altererythrobacter sp. CAU 1644]WFL76790.1 hypothetical protein P7228_12400 [Altererythrobacter sp. CAU 1644]
MLIESPLALIAVCTTGGAVLNLAMMKVSREIKAGYRHLLAGAAPTAASLAAMIGTNDSVVANGSDLMTLGASLVGGLAAAIGATKFVTPQQRLRHR